MAGSVLAFVLCFFAGKGGDESRAGNNHNVGKTEEKITHPELLLGKVGEEARTRLASPVFGVGFQIRLP
jgi:hypothetical protein